MKRKPLKLLVIVSQNRWWLGTVGKIVTLFSEDKVGSQGRRGGSVNFGKKGKVFSRAGRTS